MRETGGCGGRIDREIWWEEGDREVQRGLGTGAVDITVGIEIN